MLINGEKFYLSKNHQPGSLLKLNSLPLPKRPLYILDSQENQETLRQLAMQDFNTALKYAQKAETSYPNISWQALEMAFIAELRYDSGLDPGAIMPALEDLRPSKTGFQDEHETVVVGKAGVMALMGQHQQAFALLNSINKQSTQ